MQTITRVLASIGAVVLVLGVGYFVVKPYMQAHIEDSIKAYLLEHPEVILESVERFQKARAAARQEDSRTAIRKFQQAITDADLNVPTLGPKDAKVTVVEFFDYQCGYCKSSLATMIKLKQKYAEQVRFVFMEFPILGPASIDAAQIASTIWLQWPEKYWDFHVQVMGANFRPEVNAVKEVAASLGIKPDALETAMAQHSTRVDEIIKQNTLLARSLNISGTPAFIIGDKLFPGAMGYETLAETIEAAL